MYGRLLKISFILLVQRNIFLRLDTFAELRKATISFVMSVCRSVRMDLLGSEETDCHKIWYFNIFFRKSVGEIQVSLKYDNSNRYFTWRPIYLLITSRSVLLRVKNVSDKISRENQNAHFISNNYFFKSYRLWDNVENTIKPDTPQMTVRRMRLHTRY